MPDIDFQRIELNLIPKQGEQPVVFYASQYETTRPFIADLMWGETEFAPGGDCWAEIDIRKNDDNLVVITEDVTIDNNEVSVILPVQALTCIGKNLGQVKIYAGEDQLIAALNFILEVQPDPLAGGVTSETDIDNITQQIEDIAEEVIGEDYYDKTEVDALLADKADKSELPDMTNYYDKAETDDLLYDKVDYSELNKYYKKTEVNALLANYAEKTDLNNYYTRAESNSLFVSEGELQVKMQLEGQASGAVATFETAAPRQWLSGLKCNFICGGGNGTPSDPVPLVPLTELTVTNVNADNQQIDEITIDLDGTRYGGYVDVNNGKLKPYEYLDLSTIQNSIEFSAYYNCWIVYQLLPAKYHGASVIPNIKYEEATPTSFDDNDKGNNKVTVDTVGHILIGNNSSVTKPTAKVAYELATPIEVDISMNHLYAEPGENNVSHDGNGTTEVKYKDTIQHYIDTRL